MKEEASNPPSLEIPIGDLKKTLAKLEKQESKMLGLKNQYPNIDILDSDDGLEKKEYSIWQILSCLPNVQSRIKKIRQIILEKEKIKT